jgi:putative FmdB family regulatory protein
VPFYWYRCEECEAEFSVFHRLTETQTSCLSCEQEEVLVKLVTKPLHFKKDLKKSQVGDLTKEYIEANREILEKQKQDTKEETHE